MNVVRRLLIDDSGASMTEYAVIISLLSVGAMAMLIAIAYSSSNSLSTTTGNIQGYQAASPP